MTDVCDDCGRPYAVSYADWTAHGNKVCGESILEDATCFALANELLKSDLAALRATNERLDAECGAAGRYIEALQRPRAYTTEELLELGESWRAARKLGEMKEKA
jgi:hypothetical protein